ncbi:MAG TPA: glycoside hydrolase family 15 protein [Longimicrobiaceae bacterium]|nr:glycoside hydrolase family 15 protein [Longimicrobiaceae bacterium]
MSAPPRISDYAIIGDGRAAALISGRGSLDWLCLPRFDSPSVFGALLDPGKGGTFAIRPVGDFTAHRRYVGHTNVLETTFESANGALKLTDFMPVAGSAKRRQLWPEHEVLRRLEATAGEVEIEITCNPRPDYGLAGSDFRNRGALGFRFEHDGWVLMLRSDLPFDLKVEAGKVIGRGTLVPGARYWISLGFAAEEPAVLPMTGDVADERLRETLEWWEGWADRCAYEGPHLEWVVRSALALKLMSYSPSGAIVAAPTTSLPEQLGGSRNWDYRYCWLRDASFTTRALFDLGYHEEAESFLAWLLHATRLSWPELRVLYDVFGNSRLPERELTHLAGYAGSRPVRIGNGAHDQMQLDIYGEVVEAAFQYVQRGGELDRTAARMLVGLGKTVCRRWREPDSGIWESRSELQHYTASKVMCWIALDRLLRLHAAGHVRAPAADFEKARGELRTAIESRGYDESLGSYVSIFDSQEIDASLLLLGLHRYSDPDSPRMRGTCERIRERLGTDGLLYRSVPESDGLTGKEGAFGICSFWAIELRALQGDREGARAEFEHLLTFANDVGLFAEEIDTATGDALGNFPQAFTHIGLLTAARALTENSATPSMVQS